METETKELDAWRLALDELSLERKRQIAEAMGVHVHTLQRWATGTRSPHKIELVQQLAAAAHELREGLKEAYPEAFSENDDLEITSDDLLQFFRDKALVARHVNIYTLTSNALEQVASLLDPTEEGLMIVPYFCVANEHGIVTHLSNGEGYGTGDNWRLQQIVKTYRLGRDSLCGMAASQLRPFMYPQHFPNPVKVAANLTVHVDKINSGAAYPIQRYGQEVAGVLFYASVHKDFFNQARREVCQNFTYVYAAGLFDSQFYPHDRIQLESMHGKDATNV